MPEQLPQSASKPSKFENAFAKVGKAVCNNHSFNVMESYG